MRVLRSFPLPVAALAALPLVLTAAGPATAAPAATATAADPFVLATDSYAGAGYAPAFVGNGYLAGRQPFDGQGYALVPLPGRTEPLPTQSQVHGLFALGVPQAPEGSPPQPPVERRAALPAWSTLGYDDGSGYYTLARGRVGAYRQELDLRTGTLRTAVTWTSPAGRTADLRYEVTPDRAHRHAAAVRLTITPRFDGPVRVTDALDGRAADLLAPRERSLTGTTQEVSAVTAGLGVPVTVASTLVGPAAPDPVPVADRLSAQQAVAFRVRRGTAYTVTKYVGIATGSDSADPRRTAVDASRGAAVRGWAALRQDSDAAWARLWRSDVQVGGDARLQGQVRSAFFALLASVRDDTPWAPSPGGLSSDGYNGHVFWDSETWMFPTLLATEPDLARQSLEYRVDRLPAARAYAAATGSRGARFPWESALRGTEETPAFANTGLYEVHVSADVALAAWQYWLATGDRAWLAAKGWPLLAGIADYWVSRATRYPDGTYGVRGVIPPDEYVEQVDDSVYTNVAARDALRFATLAAGLLGRTPDPRWAAVSGRLRVPLDPATGVHPEYAGYPGDAVKQADVTLLAYPWENAQPRAVTAADLDYYVPRTDPGGPSMTDAIHSVVTAELGTPGCAAFTFTRRSVDPFLRPPYDQFSEARSGGAFTFTTGAGGFLQEFLYGYTGFRWRADRVRLDPSLPPQLTGVTASVVHWRGRELRIAVGPRETRVSLLSGPPAPVETPGFAGTVAAGADLVLPTRRADLVPTANAARCRPATATPATAEPAEAAVDGTPVTQWIGLAARAALTVDLGAAAPVRAVTVTRNAVTTYPAPEGADKGVTRPTVSAGERVEASADGRTWRLLATVTRPGLRDAVAGDGRPARYLRVVALGATADRPLIVGELAATR